MQTKLIGIAGGSGAGKSTVCYYLVDNYPDQFEVVNLDDYQKKKTESDLPMINGNINWDHPDIIDWNKLLADLRRLLDGGEVTLEVWSHRSNPDYASHGNMLPRTIMPKPVILVEGYLALYNPELNTLYDRSFYLDIDDGVRELRRGKNEVIGDPDYVKNVLAPMHKKYVEPTINNANGIIDASDMSVETIAEVIRGSI